jgi:LacI family transcriptional regulator
LKIKRVTIKDIARELGVHHTTVSLALRNSHLLRDETREKIQARAKKMGYRPNRLAQGFRRRSSRVIGILVPAIHHHFFSKFISEITEFAFEAGYSIMVLPSNEKLETEKMNIEALIDNRVAGVIASISLETRNSRHFKVFVKEEVPLVFFDRIPNDFQGTTVVVNNYQLAYDAVELMIKKGRKTIAFITGSSHINVFSERTKGYKDALKRNHFAVDEKLIIDSGFEIINGAKAAKKLMSYKIKPDGILAVNDQVAMGAIKFLKRSGNRVPEDISVIGFDNDSMGLAVEPELTTCNQPIDKLARTALNAIMDQIENPGTARKNFIINGNLLLRNSC